MAEIKELPTWELVSDLHTCMVDAIVCCNALALGVLDVFGSSVIERLDNNLAMYNKIHAELVVRGVVHATMTLDTRSLRETAKEMAQWERNRNDLKVSEKAGSA